MCDTNKKLVESVKGKRKQRSFSLPRFICLQVPKCNCIQYLCTDTFVASTKDLPMNFLRPVFVVCFVIFYATEQKKLATWFPFLSVWACGKSSIDVLMNTGIQRQRRLAFFSFSFPLLLWMCVFGVFGGPLLFHMHSKRSEMLFYSSVEKPSQWHMKHINVRMLSLISVHSWFVERKAHLETQ